MKRSTDCERIEKLLPLFIEDDLPDADSAAVSAHISGCAECRRSFESYIKLEETLGSMPEILPDPRVVSSAVSIRLGLERKTGIALILRRISLVSIFGAVSAAVIILAGRFDYVPTLTSWLKSFADSASSAMDRWATASGQFLSGLSGLFETPLSVDPWILAAGLIGFGLLIFSAGIAAALRSMR
jgi:anti-sigma factor RsiW